MNPYAIPSLIGFSILVGIGIYVLYKNPKNKINRVFSLGVLAGVIAIFGEFMKRISTSDELALFWGKVEIFGCILIPPAFLHFTYVFPKTRIKKERFLFVVYLPILILLPLLTTDLLVKGTHIYYAGYGIAWGPLLPFLSAYLILLCCYGFGNLGKSYIYSDSQIERVQIKFVTIGIAIVGVATLSTSVMPSILSILLAREIEIYPLSSSAGVVTAGFVAYAIVKYKLFVITPTAENYIEIPKYELRPRYSYLVEEEKATKSFEIFADQVTHGIEGLCISRKHPELIKERYGLDKVPKIWLTAEIADDSLKPTDLALLTLTIRDFIDKTENGVVLLDGIDYLLLNNSFESVVKTLNSINDSIMRSKSRLILSINPAEFSAKQFALLSKNLEKIET